MYVMLSMFLNDYLNLILSFYNKQCDLNVYN